MSDLLCTKMGLLHLPTLSEQDADITAYARSGNSSQVGCELCGIGKRHNPDAEHRSVL